MCLFWLKLCLFLGFGMQTGGYHTTDIDYMTKECTFKWQKVPPNTVKSAEICLFLGYFSLNIGHSDLLFCKQADVDHRGHNHPTWVTSASNCRNVPPKTLKSAQICLFLGYFSINTSHSDPLFCMQVDFPHRGHNHPTWITSASNCRNVPPMLTDGRRTDTS